MGGAPSLKMIAHYDDYCENFEVDLWEEGKGFILQLTFKGAVLHRPSCCPKMRIAVSSYLQSIFLQRRPYRCTSCGLPPPLSYT